MKAFAVLLCSAVVAALSVSVTAHQETLKGKVLSVAPTSVRVNVVDPETRREVPMTFTTNEKTRVLRGDELVSFAGAKIQNDENIAVTVDHDVDITLALVIRLDAAK
jgi:hypothetical protein